MVGTVPRAPEIVAEPNIGWFADGVRPTNPIRVAAKAGPIGRHVRAGFGAGPAATDGFALPAPRGGRRRTATGTRFRPPRRVRTGHVV